MSHRSKDIPLYNNEIRYLDLAHHRNPFVIGLQILLDLSLCHIFITIVIFTIILNNL